ncbi:glycoside hydrolase family 99-like domain-containing protein [Phyllobacterium zundukense]|uniref:Glycoside hydrolase family 99-like domain-containing protein n=1 Tax=Phyllobacterium zundukense TaxID=1867719 RepID=A0ACD4CZG5_9HYPH|nr:glycoside hydrolase family 99-like domain-containing protein [Phyllobacterium zundukense]UXN58951.1 glycoside hydrolase family 99-like domain-containing protein [Phyllobacterium zundukense]
MTKADKPVQMADAELRAEQPDAELFLWREQAITLARILERTTESPSVTKGPGRGATQLRRVTELRASLKASRSQNRELRAELLDRDRMIDAAQRDRETVQSELLALRSSTLWRALGPVRKIARVIPRPVRTLMRSPISALTRIVPSREQNPPLESAPSAIAIVNSDESSVATIEGKVIHRPSAFFRDKNSQWVEPMLRSDRLLLKEFKPTARIAVVMHLYYTDLWDELSDSIMDIPEAFDLFVSLVGEENAPFADRIRQTFPDAQIIQCDNHGRDIIPFLEIVATGVLYQYDYICKLHSKKSVYREGGGEWRQHLVDGVLRDTDRVTTILAAFDADPDMGMHVADGAKYKGREYWAGNEAHLGKYLPWFGLSTEVYEQEFAGGSVFWIRPFLLREVDSLKLNFDDFEPEPIGIDGNLAHAVERLFSVACHNAGMRITTNTDLENGSRQADRAKPPLIIANYLPQFHPIPENDRVWGKGFTEWTNVTRAQPQCKYHRQPKLPSELGFYDLRLPEIREQQASLAKAYGISAFCYYYYWFNGRKVLETPLESVLRAGQPDFPFMICWANEPWSRNWDGLSKETIIPQTYEDGWELKFAADILPLLQDDRYLRISGKRCVAIYRVQHIPNAKLALEKLRAELLRNRITDVQIIGGWLRLGDDAELPDNPSDLGLDGYFEFPPHNIPTAPETTRSIETGDSINGYNYNYTVDAAVDAMSEQRGPKRYRGVTMGWDNTARRGKDAHIFLGASPASFRRWLRATVLQIMNEKPVAEDAVFVNAWNEWAEGTYLEPDQTFGRGWLEAVSSAIGRKLSDENVYEREGGEGRTSIETNIKATQSES